MHWEQRGFTPAGMVAAADLRTKQYYGVKITSTGINLAAADGEVIDGILQNKPNTGQTAEVVRDGIVPCVAGEAIAVGDKLMVANGGKILKATGTGKHIIGKAVEAAAADGSTFSAYVTCGAGVV